MAAGDTDDPTLYPLASTGTFFPLVVLMDRVTGDRKWARTYDGAQMYVKRAVFSPDATRVATFIGYSVGYPMDS